MKKFKDALNGVLYALKHRAVLVQLLLAICAIIGGLIIKLDQYEWMAFILCISMVISSEIFNTAIEKIGDYLNEEYDERIKIIKDLASGAVLINSIASLIICIICVIRRFG